MNLLINDILYSSPLLVFALKEESGNKFDNYNTVFTGVGKINASYKLLKGIHQFKPDIVINLGTAGGFGLKRGEVVVCNEFVQRDMDVTPLGFPKYVTPFELSNDVLRYGILLDGFKKATCGTGDCFEINHNTTAYNVVDMEAYALAKICKAEGIPFLCFKYISDGADGNAVSDWNEEVNKASNKLSEIVSNLLNSP